MIDYLERVFSPETVGETAPAPEGLPLPRMGEISVETGGQGELPSVETEVGTLPRMPQVSPGEGRQAVLTAPQVEGGERFIFPVGVELPREGEGDPIKKLRRDSRRYDSGFCWY